jgi:hypothetical protein
MEQSRFTTIGMGFYEDLISGLDSVIQKRFGNKPYRLAVAAKTTATHVDRIRNGERQKFLLSVGRILDAAGLRLIEGGSIPEDEYAFIPRALAKPAAGGGSLETSGETEGALAFRREWISRKTRTSPERLRVMVVAGDSMSPTIDDGDIVLVDEGCQGGELKEGRVYVIRKGDEIFVKRFRKGVGCLLFMGDNRGRDYLDVEVKEGDEDGFRVIGRVLWAGKEL